jgi:hypothetical protein
MKISVVTVCYNADAVIEGCLRSVAEQTHRDIEHIVIDGLSSDGTVAAVRRYPHVTTLVSERDQGIYDAMNKGLDHVTGDYVLFLNADDRFSSATSLAKAVAAIERDRGADVYYGWLEVRPLDGTSHVFRPPQPADVLEFMVVGCLPHQSTLARPSVFVKTGRFDLRYRYHADYDWFLKILADPTIDVRPVDSIIGSFRLGGASSQLAEGQPEVFAIQNRSPLYATPEWDKKRIAALQGAFLRERIDAARLREEIRTARARTRDLRSIGALRDCGSREPIGDARPITASTTRTAVRLIGDAVQSRLQRLRWWILATCVRCLPHSAVDVLRRVRARTMGTPGDDAADPGDGRALAHLEKPALRDNANSKNGSIP